MADEPGGRLLPRKNGVGRPFKKGQSGNPKGRPRRGEAMTDLLQEFLEKPQEELEKLAAKKHGLLAKERLAIKLILEGLKGKRYLTATKYMFDRVDGTPRQSIEHTGEMKHQGLIVVRNPKDGANADGNS